MALATLVCCVLFVFVCLVGFLGVLFWRGGKCFVIFYFTFSAIDSLDLVLHTKKEF